jgi:VanZ family protein
MKTQMLYRRAPPLLQRVIMAAAFALAVFILVKSLGPMTMRVQISNADKVLHVAAYFALGLLAYPAAARVKPLYVWMALVGFGLCIEVLQGAMSAGRTADILDGIANAAGALLAMLAWWVLSVLVIKVSPKT